MVFVPLSGTWGFRDSSLKCKTALTTPHQNLAVVSHQRPPKAFLCKGQGSLLALVPCIVMYTIQNCVVLGGRNHKGQDSCLSPKHDAYIQEPFTQDQAVPHVKKHMALLHLCIFIQVLPQECIPFGKGVSFWCTSTCGKWQV